MWLFFSAATRCLSSCLLRFSKEKIKPYMIGTLLFSLAGMLCILNPAHLAPEYLKGGLLTLLSAFIFALYTILGKFRSTRYGGIATTCFSFLTASIEMMVLVGLSHIPILADSLNATGLSIFSRIPLVEGISSYNIIGLLYVSIFVSGLGYSFYFLAAEETSAVMSSLVFYIKPALASFFAFIFLHESISALTIAGIALIMCGSAVSFISAKRDVKVSV